MAVESRSLSVEMHGEDVALLQRELRQLGFSFSEAELDTKFYGPDTHQAVLVFQRQHSLPVTGVVDEATAKAINAAVDALRPAPKPVVGPTPGPGPTPSPSPSPASDPAPGPSPAPGPLVRGAFLVRGQVRQADGSVLTGATVRAVDKDLRTEQPLGETTTDSDGRYDIHYSSDQFSRDEKGSADLIVRVFAAPKPGGPLAPSTAAPGAALTPLVSSAILFNAPAIAVVDLMVGGGSYAGPSEYEALLADLTPVLQGVNPGDLKDDDIAFLHGETGEDALHIRLLANAHQLSRGTEVLPEAFYGLTREGMPLDLGALLARGPEALRRALQAAIDDNIVPGKLSGAMDEILRRLQGHMVTHALDGMQPAGLASLASVLGTVLPDASKQQTLMSLYAQRTGTTEEFWQTLAQHPDFSAPGQVEAVQTAIQVSVLAQNHAPMVQQLQQLRQQGKWKTLRDLAQFEVSDWLRLVQIPGVGVPPGMPGKDDAARAQNYAAFMASLMERTFPTAAMVARMKEENPEGTSDLQRFFTNSPDFELDKTHIDSYLAANRATAMTGVQSPDALTPQLKAVQRVFKVAPNYDQMKVLLDAGLHSARNVAQMGKSAFVTSFAAKLGGTAQAEAVFARAERAAAAAAVIYGKFAPAMNAVDPMVTRRSS